ncbi:MAG: hypothetical protein U0R69_10700 [Gaiellales bacterium]
MAVSVLETRSTTDPTIAPFTPRMSVETAERASDSQTARCSPSLALLTFLTVVLIAGLGALVWYFAGGGVDGAIVAGVVTAGLAMLVGSYASVFVTRRRH